MNTLGMAAVQGIDVVLRHSFFDYGYTHLVDQHFNPLPVSLSISLHIGISASSHCHGFNHNNEDLTGPCYALACSAPDPVPLCHLFPVGAIS